MKSITVSQCEKSQQQFTELVELIAQRNLRQVMHRLREGYCLSVEILDLMVEAGWKMSVRLYLQENTFSFRHDDTEDLAEWIIAFLGREKAENLFAGRLWKVFKPYLGAEYFAARKDWDSCVEFGFWQPLIDAKKFDLLPQNKSDWMMLMAQQGYYDELYERGLINPLVLYGNREKVCEFLALKQDWTRLYQARALLFENRSDVWSFIYDRGGVRFLYDGNDYGQNFLLQKKDFFLFIKDKRWQTLCAAKADPALIDWDDFYSKNQTDCLAYACKYKQKDFLRKKGHWLRALFC